MKEFTNCLRVQIFPGHHEDERIEKITSFCKKYNFQNVMLFINAVNYNVGHMTIEEAKPWVATIKKAKKILNENGISVSLNPWIDIGSYDGGRTLKKGQNFRTMVDRYGTECAMVVCPLCEEWRKYFFEFYEYLLTEIQPEVVWVEDDLRLHNHAPLDTTGCFCDEHMLLYCEKLGKTVSREEFQQGVFGPNVIEEYKKVWLDECRRTICDLAKAIGDKVRSLGLKTKVGLMSSGPIGHCMEARDWSTLTHNLMGEQQIHRISLPCYTEETGKEYCFNFSRMSMVIREWVERDSKIYPEMEIGTFSPFSKSARFMQFQLESALPLILEGMTYDIFEFAGNGALEEYGYGQMVKSRMPFFNAVINLPIKYDDLVGIIVPIDQDCSYHIKPNGKPEDLFPTSMDIGAYLSAFGFNVRYSRERCFKDKMLAFSGYGVDNYTDEEMTQMLNDNQVILDGGAALRLWERGFGKMLNIKSVERYKTAAHVGTTKATSLKSFEQAVDGNVIYGVKNRRSSVHSYISDYYKVEYENDTEVKMMTEVFDNQANFFGSGIAKIKNGMILPFLYESIYSGFVRLHYELFNYLRTETIKKLMRETSYQGVITDTLGLHCMRYKNDNTEVLMLINSNVDNIEKLNFEMINTNANRIFVIDRETGEKKEVSFENKGDKYKLNLGIEGLSVQVLIIE